MLLTMSTEVAYILVVDLSYATSSLSLSVCLSLLTMATEVAYISVIDLSYATYSLFLFLSFVFFFPLQ